MHLRQATIDDYEQIAELFTETILKVNIRDYTSEQVQIWSARVKDRDRWLRKIEEQYFLLMEESGELCGTGSITPEGYLDMMYVSHRRQGQGIARKLFSALEDFARRNRLPRIHSDVSLTARPFFERMGFRVVRPQQVVMAGVVFDNFVMEKPLPTY